MRCVYTSHLQTYMDRLRLSDQNRKITSTRKLRCVKYYQRATGGKDAFDGGVASDAIATTGRVNPLLFLAAVAEPDPNYFLLHVELVSDHGNLFRGRFLVLLEEGKEARDSLSVLRRLFHCAFNRFYGVGHKVQTRIM